MIDQSFLILLLGSFHHSTQPIKCTHPLVHRGMLDIDTFHEIPFTYYNRERPRPSLKILKGDSVTRSQSAIKEARRVNDGTKHAAPSNSSPSTVAAPESIRSVVSPPATNLAVPKSAVPVPSKTLRAPKNVQGTNKASGKVKSQKPLKFPFVLALLMEELDENQLSSLIHWDLTGTAVMLRRSPANASETRLLRRYFDHGLVRHVQRQLDQYRFQKTQRDE